MARTLGENGKECQAEGEAKVVTWKKTQLDNARRLRGIYFIDREDKELKETIKNARKKLKRQWLPLCLARQARTVSMGRHMAKTMRSNQNLRVSWKPVNPQDCVWKNLYRIIMMTILQERVTIHCNITIRYTNIFRCLKSWRFSQQKQQWIKNVRNWKRFWRGTWRKSEVKKRWSMKQGRRALKFILSHGHLSVIWRMPNWRQSTKNTKVELYSEAILWKMILDLVQYLLNKGHQHHKWQQQTSWISYPDCHGGQAADAVSAYTQVKMEDAPKQLKIPKSECPDIWIRLPRHKWPKSWSSMEDPVVPLERNLYGHPLAGLLWERQFEKILLKYGWEKVSNWVCVWRQRSRDQDDVKGKESHDETCFQDPQSCA